MSEGLPTSDTIYFLIFSSRGLMEFPAVAPSSRLRRLMVIAVSGFGYSVENVMRVGFKRRRYRLIMTGVSRPGLDNFPCSWSFLSFLCWINNGEASPAQLD